MAKENTGTLHERDGTLFRLYDRGHRGHRFGLDCSRGAILAGVVRADICRRCTGRATTGHVVKNHVWVLSITTALHPVERHFAVFFGDFFLGDCHPGALFIDHLLIDDFFLDRWFVDDFLGVVLRRSLFANGDFRSSFVSDHDLSSAQAGSDTEHGKFG